MRDERILLDEHDQALYSEAFVLAEAVRRFLARRSTQRAWEAGLLDDDVVRPLVESADRMWLIRTQRVGVAREHGDDDCAACLGSGRRWYMQGGPHGIGGRSKCDVCNGTGKPVGGGS